MPNYLLLCYILRQNYFETTRIISLSVTTIDAFHLKGILQNFKKFQLAIHFFETCNEDICNKHARRTGTSLSPSSRLTVSAKFSTMSYFRFSSHFQRPNWPILVEILLQCIGQKLGKFYCTIVSESNFADSVTVVRTRSAGHSFHFAVSCDIKPYDGSQRI